MATVLLNGHHSGKERHSILRFSSGSDFTGWCAWCMIFGRRFIPHMEVLDVDVSVGRRFALTPQQQAFFRSHL